MATTTVIYDNITFFYSLFPPLFRPSTLKGPTPQLFCPPSVYA